MLLEVSSRFFINYIFPPAVLVFLLFCLFRQNTVFERKKWTVSEVSIFRGGKKSHSNFMGNYKCFCFGEEGGAK